MHDKSAVKYFGIWLDLKVEWKKYAEYVINKISKSLLVLYR